MRDYLEKVRARVPVAVVSGSDLSKIAEQLGDNVEDG